MTGRQCNHSSSAHIGFVTNNRENDISRPMSGRTVCSRPDCIKNAISDIAGRTNETASLYPFRGRFLPADLQTAFGDPS